jgi:16S rRNA (uracil1498-N3)-methyltransferase
MRIPRIYQATSLSSDREIELDAVASQHLLKVLRLREGAAVIVFDGNGVSYQGALTPVRGKTATVRLQHRIDEQAESALRLHVGLGISKGERMDFAIQKLVETGVHRITPLLTEHTVVKLDDKREQTRLQHWQGVIINACEQCGRNNLPQLQTVRKLSEWMDTITEECKLVFDAAGTTTLQSIQPPPQTVAVLIGPEGGLSEHEVSYAGRQGFHVVRLGPRILRTETAAVAISAALQTMWGDY